jgi:hypothetical protein
MRHVADRGGGADADPRAKIEKRGHSAAWIPVDVFQTLMKQTMSDDSDVYLSIIEY